MDPILYAVEIEDREKLTSLMDPLHPADIADLLEQITPFDRARLIRLASGGFRFGIGHGEGMSLDEGTGGGSTEQGLEAMSTLINGFLGQTDLPPELLKLERVEIRGADLVYDDRQTGTAWRAPNADFVIWRSDETVEAQLKIAVVFS